MPWSEATHLPRVVSEVEAPARFEIEGPRGPGHWTASRDRGATSARVVVIEHGIALSTGAVFDERGRFHPSASHDQDFVDHPRRLPRRFLPEPHRFLPGLLQSSEIVGLTASNQRFYFHWLLDVLPRLHLAEQAGFGEGPFFVEVREAFQRDSLEMLGVLDRCARSDAGRTAVTGSRLVVPCHRVLPGRAIPAWTVDFLRTRILERLDSRRSTTPRLYVSRRRAGHRRVLNEVEVIRALSHHGFVSVELETLPFVEQVRLFRDAKTIVAPHGGGLANLVFSRPRTQVIELFPATNIDLYYRLASSLGLTYRHLKSEDGPRDSMGPEDYRVDVAALQRSVEAAIGSSDDSSGGEAQECGS